MTHRIVMHGLVISMPFACPDLVSAPMEAVADVVVQEGGVPERLAEADVRDEWHDVNASAFLVRGGPHSGRFLVTQGRHIRFQRGERCDQTLLRHVLLSRAMAGLLRQRDLLVLHASGAVSPTGVVLVTGDSGAGKSTTVAALTAAGWPLQTDDLTALGFIDGRGVEVLPGGGHIHLFEAASQSLSLDTGGAAPNPWHRMKMAVPGTVEALRAARRLRRIVHLERGAAGEGLRVEPVQGGAKLTLLLGNIYGPYLPGAIMAQAALVSQALLQVEMMRVVRPDGEWTMDGVLAAIMADAAPMGTTTGPDSR